ncbi:hypothetical protein TYRP_013069 [Tyrophagus putrescentiae]|nr:hypothetical protein TYRP_013069 [Tyrophagus putrescentiae]
MLNLEKTPMVSHSSNRSATLPNRSLSLGLNNNTNKNNSPTSSPLMSNSAQMSPDKQDIALLQEQYRLVYEGRKALQRKCNALEEHLETLKADREQLQRAGLQANAELARLRAASSATVPRADFEALQQQTASLTPQLEELRTRERRLGKELEEYQAVARQLQAEIGELQEENDQLRANRVAMEAKQAAIEATILEMDVQSGEQHKELECLRSQLVKCEEEASGLRSIVSQLADSRLAVEHHRRHHRRFNSSTVSLVSNDLPANTLSQASSINTLTSAAAATVVQQPTLPPFNRRSLSAAPTRRAAAHPVSRAASITTTTTSLPSSDGGNHHHHHHHHHNSNSNNLGESMAIVRTRDLELQLEERELELVQLREQLELAGGEAKTLKEQSALDKERIKQLEQDLREVQSQWSVLVLQNTASAEDLNNNEDQEKEKPIEMDYYQQDEQEKAEAEATAVNEKLDSLNNNNNADSKSSSTKKPKKSARRWYCIFTVCVTGKPKQSPAKSK